MGKANGDSSSSSDPDDDDPGSSSNSESSSDSDTKKKRRSRERKDKKQRYKKKKKKKKKKASSPECDESSSRGLVQTDIRALEVSEVFGHHRDVATFHLTAWGRVRTTSSLKQLNKTTGCCCCCGCASMSCLARVSLDGARSTGKAQIKLTHAADSS